MNSNRECPHCGHKQPVMYFNVNQCAFCGQDMKNIPPAIYVAGGIYRVEQGKEYFYLVKPSGPELPYIARNGDKLFSHTQHHAHLYRVISEYALVLERVSYEAEAGGVGAPISPILPPPAIDALKKALDKLHFVC